MSRPMLAQKTRKLASEVPLGTCIVELGTKHGKSAILYSEVVKGRIEIFSFDDYDANRINWLGSKYEPDDEKTCLENIEQANANVVLCRIKIEDAAKRWIRAIGLLSWDIGQPERFRKDFEDWSKFVIIGGVVIVKDTSGNQFGTFEVIAELIDGSAWERFDYLNGYSFLRRTE